MIGTTNTYEYTRKLLESCSRGLYVVRAAEKRARGIPLLGHDSVFGLQCLVKVEESLVLSHQPPRSILNHVRNSTIVSRDAVNCKAHVQCR